MSVTNKYTSDYLERLRMLLMETTTKDEHVHILSIILKNQPTCTVNENQSGTMINMRTLSTQTIDALVTFLHYKMTRKNVLKEREDETQECFSKMNSVSPAVNS